MNAPATPQSRRAVFYPSPPSTPVAGITPVTPVTPNKPRFKWDNKHRQVLSVLVDHLQYDWPQSLAVFNEVFKETCSVLGFPDGLSRRVLISQWNDRLHGSSKRWQQAEISGEAELEELAVNLRRVHALLADKERTGQIVRLPSASHYQLQTPTTSPRSRRSLEDRRRRPSPAVVITVPARRQNNRAYTPTPTAQKGQRGVFSRVPKKERKKTRILHGEEVPLLDANGPDISDFQYSPITKEEAHPPIPSLLFRFYDEYSHGENGRDGFTAGNCMRLTTGFPPPPSYSDPNLLTWIETHFHKGEIATPFISTSSNLFFTLRLATKSSRSKPRISILRGDVASDGDRAFHALAYHKRLVELVAFTDGCWINASLHEYLIWARIPSRAILGDFSLEDLQRQLTRIPHMQAALRIDEMIISSNRSNTRIQKGFRENPIALTDSLTKDLASLLLCFGIDASTPMSMIAKIVSEFIRGWNIVVHKDYAARWALLASIFTYALTDGHPEIPKAQLEMIKEAFLVGLESGLGPINWHLNPDKMNQMQRKCLTKGLGAHRHVAEDKRIEARSAGQKRVRAESVQERRTVTRSAVKAKSQRLVTTQHTIDLVSDDGGEDAGEQGTEDEEMLNENDTVLESNEYRTLLEGDLNDDVMDEDYTVEDEDQGMLSDTPF